MATSLTVPCTASEPMSPPGKNSGETTKVSVDITMRPAATSKAAWSLPRASSGLSKAAAENLLDELLPWRVRPRRA